MEEPVITDEPDKSDNCRHDDMSAAGSSDTAHEGPAVTYNDTNLSGMSPDQAKEYILNFITTLKLTERQILDLDDEIAKWRSRMNLAGSRDACDLVQEAEKELNRLTEKQQTLKNEAEQLKLQIEEMRRQIPLLAARQRSIDPDLLEQELLIAAGYLPGDEEKARNERLFRNMEKEQAADDALRELKAKLGK